MEEALIGVDIEIVLSEMAEYHTDMSFVLFFRVRVDEDIIQVYQHAYIKQITEDVIHEVLEGSGHVCKSEGHDTPFERAVAGAESGLPFIALTDVDPTVYMVECK